MSDTKAGIERRLLASYSARSAADRVRMATSMFGEAKAIARAGITAAEGPLSETEMRQFLLRRFYGADFSAAQLADIRRSIAAENVHKAEKGDPLEHWPTPQQVKLPQGTVRDLIDDDRGE